MKILQENRGFSLGVKMKKSKGIENREDQNQ